MGMRFGEVKSSDLEHVELPLELSSGSTTTRQSSLVNRGEEAKDAEEEEEEVQQVSEHAPTLPSRTTSAPRIRVNPQQRHESLHFPAAEEEGRGKKRTQAPNRLSYEALGKPAKSALAGAAMMVGDDDEIEYEEFAFTFSSPVEMPGEPTTLKEALESSDAEEWKKAMESEMKSIEENGMWELPEGFDDGSGRVLKLKKALYGSKQAPRQWYLKMRGDLEEIGFTSSTADHSLFMLGKGEHRSFIGGSTFKPPQVAASAQVSASGQVAPPCSCRLLSHQTLLWYHRLGHPSLPRLRGMHSHLLVCDLPRSLPPLPPSRALPCLSCVKGRQRAALQSFSFPVMTIPFRLSTWTCGGQLASVDRAARATFCCVFLGLPPDAPSWQFYHPTSRRVFPSQEVTFDESVPFYGLFTYSYAPPPPLPPFLAPGPPPVDPLAPQGAAQGAASGGAGPRGAEFEGVGSGGAEPRGAEPAGAEPAGVEPEGAQPEGVEAGGAESEGAESGGAEPQGTASSRGLKGSSPRLSTGLSLSAPPSDESVESSGRLAMPLLFPGLLAFSSVTDLISHLRSLDATFHAAFTADDLGEHAPPSLMYLTLHLIAARLPNRLAHACGSLLAMHPISLTIDLFEISLTKIGTRLRTVASTFGAVVPPIFEGGGRGRGGGGGAGMLRGANVGSARSRDNAAIGAGGCVVTPQQHEQTGKI
ncbi:unnamed protein product [Closterium sp. NIES-54]